ncbi:MAG: hypothetical protein SVK44_05910 [Nitrospirota bacterium]|nr:hypothetical protein [Nitrospirota bacterium]
MRVWAAASLLWVSAIACLCLPSALWAEPSWEESCIYPLLHAWDERGPFISCEIDTEKAVGCATYEGGYTMELKLGEPPVVSLGILGYPRVYSHNEELLYTLVPESVPIEGRNALRYTMIDANGQTYTYRGISDGQRLFLEVGCPDGSLARYDFPTQEGAEEGIDEGFACLERSYAQALSQGAQVPAAPAQPSLGAPPSASTPAPTVSAPAQSQPPRPVQAPEVPPQQVPMPQSPPADLPVSQGDGWYPLEPLSPGWEEWVFLMSRIGPNP